MQVYEQVFLSLELLYEQYVILSFAGSSSTTVLTTPCNTNKPPAEGKPPYHYSDLIEFALKDEVLVIAKKRILDIFSNFTKPKSVKKNVQGKNSAIITSIATQNHLLAIGLSDGSLSLYRSKQRR